MAALQSAIEVAMTEDRVGTFRLLGEVVTQFGGDTAVALQRAEDDFEVTKTQLSDTIKLKDDEVFSNGIGELEVLYNDGLVRIVRDSLQDNTYIHVREPVPMFLEEFL